MKLHFLPPPLHTTLAAQPLPPSPRPRPPIPGPCPPGKTSFASARSQPTHPPTHTHSHTQALLPPSLLRRKGTNTKEIIASPLDSQTIASHPSLPLLRSTFHNFLFPHCRVLLPLPLLPLGFEKKIKRLEKKEKNMENSVRIGCLWYGGKRM